jgi:hypothetical protein
MKVRMAFLRLFVTSVFVLIIGIILQELKFDSIGNTVYLVGGTLAIISLIGIIVSGVYYDYKKISKESK